MNSDRLPVTVWPILSGVLGMIVVTALAPRSWQDRPHPHPVSAATEVVHLANRPLTSPYPSGFPAESISEYQRLAQKPTPRITTPRSPAVAAERSQTPAASAPGRAHPGQLSAEQLATEIGLTNRPSDPAVLAAAGAGDAAADNGPSKGHAEAEPTDRDRRLASAGPNAAPEAAASSLEGAEGGNAVDAEPVLSDFQLRLPSVLVESAEMLFAGGPAPGGTPSAAAPESRRLPTEPAVAARVDVATGDDAPGTGSAAGDESTRDDGAGGERPLEPELPHPRSADPENTPASPHQEPSYGDADLPPVPDGDGLPDVSPVRPAPAATPQRPPGHDAPEHPQRVAEPQYAVALAKSYRDQLAAAGQYPWARPWLSRVEGELQRMPAITTSQAAPVLRRLGKLCEQGNSLVNSVPATQAGRSTMIATVYGLHRRVAVWSSVNVLATQPAPASGQFDAAAVSSAVGELRLLTSDADHRAWQAYLMLDELEAAVAGSQASDAPRLQATARELLARVRAPQLTPPQRAYLRQPPVVDLLASMRHWAGETPDWQAVVAQVEAHEDGLRSATRELAATQRMLSLSSDRRAQELAGRMDTYYRNANVRLAIAHPLISRWVPANRVVREPVRDEILGADVRGDSVVLSDLKLQFHPAEDRWNLSVLATGQVNSRTHATRGPVTTYNTAVTRYAARQPVVIGPSGWSLPATETGADVNTTITDLETPLDGVPLLGWMARSYAEKRYYEELPAAKQETGGKVRGRVARELNRQLTSEISTLEQQLNSRFWTPAANLQLDPRIVELSTRAPAGGTSRLIGRLRLAGSGQLAAATPRPQAPGNSLLSFQLHQSAINNLIEQLRLEGRVFTLEELFGELSTRLNLTDLKLPEEAPREVRVQFDAEQAAEVTLREGRCEIDLRFAGLDDGHGRQYYDFAIRVAYRPQIEGLQVSLVRDGIVEVAGENLGFRDRFPLRTIFVKVFAKSRPIPLVPATVAEVPQLAQLTAQQAVIRQGWLGLAFAPRQLAAAPATKQR